MRIIFYLLLNLLMPTTAWCMITPDTVDTSFITYYVNEFYSASKKSGITAGLATLFQQIHSDFEGNSDNIFELLADRKDQAQDMLKQYNQVTSQLMQCIPKAMGHTQEAQRTRDKDYLTITRLASVKTLSIFCKPFCIPDSETIKIYTSYRGTNEDIISYLEANKKLPFAHLKTIKSYLLLLGYIVKNLEKNKLLTE